VSDSGKPLIVGVKYYKSYKWKVYIPSATHAPSFSDWDTAIMVANEVAYRHLGLRVTSQHVTTRDSPLPH
jgi:hypothetical protein